MNPLLFLALLGAGGVYAIKKKKHSALVLMPVVGDRWQVKAQFTPTLSPELKAKINTATAEEKGIRLNSMHWDGELLLVDFTVLKIPQGMAIGQRFELNKAYEIDEGYYVTLLSATKKESGAGTVVPLEVSKVFTDQSTGVLAVKDGEVFALALPENPSTGYHWEMRAIDATLPPAQARLELLREQYIPDNPNPPPGFVGGGGKMYFVFKAVKPNMYAIPFVLLPPGKDAPPSRMVTFGISVGAAS